MVQTNLKLPYFLPGRSRFESKLEPCRYAESTTVLSYFARSRRLAGIKQLTNNVFSL